MRACLFLLLILFIPTSFAQYTDFGYVDSWHKPGYFFLFNNRHYYPDYQEPRFYKYSSDCRCPPKHRYCGCNPAFTQKKHFYRFVDPDGLSVEYYIR